MATINRLAASKRPAGAKCQPVEQKSQYLKSKCTRCRSWSPALLSKLEDCIYQIKSRIPKLSSARETNEQGHDSMHQESSDTSQSKRRLSGDVLDIDSKQDEPNNEHYSSDSQGEGEDLDSDREDDCDLVEIDDNCEDQFNERELLDWSQRRKEIAQKYHRRRQLSRMQHQSSINSDTLSTRTGATVLTNMSVSFDSNTNIANLGYKSGEIEQNQTANKDDEVRSELDKDK